MPEQQRRAAAQPIAARAKSSRGAAAYVWFPLTRDGRPVEPLSAVLRGQEAETGRVAPGDLEYCLGECLKNGARRVGQRVRQRRERNRFPLVIGRPRRATTQLLGTKNRFQRNVSRGSGMMRVLAMFRYVGFNHGLTQFCAASFRCQSTLLFLFIKWRARILHLQAFE